MTNDNSRTPDGLATSQQVKHLTEALQSTEEYWDECEAKLHSAKTELDGTLTSIQGAQAELVSAKTDFEGAIKLGAESQVVKERMHKSDSKIVKNSVQAICDKLNKHVPISLTAVNESIGTLNAAIRNWQRERKEIATKIQSLLPMTTAYELSKEYAETRKTTNLRGYYWGIVGIIVVYAVLAILSIFHDSLAGIYVPLLPISAVLFLLIQQIRQKTRMDEEYRHKETLMKTYVGFSQSDELTEAQQNALSQVAIDSVERNPASTASTSQSILLRPRNWPV